MEEQLISFETAELAKEKGFNWGVARFYNVNAKLKWCFANGLGNAYVNSKQAISAPTQSLLQKWLRDKHKIHLDSAITFGDQYSFMVYKGNNPQTSHITNDGTYEESLEKGLLESLKLIP